MMNPKSSRPMQQEPHHRTLMRSLSSSGGSISSSEGDDGYGDNFDDDGDVVFHRAENFLREFHRNQNILGAIGEEEEEYQSPRGCLPKKQAVSCLSSLLSSDEDDGGSSSSLRREDDQHEEEEEQPGGGGGEWGHFMMDDHGESQGLPTLRRTKHCVKYRQERRRGRRSHHKSRF